MFEARTNICEGKSLETLIDNSRAAGGQAGNEIVSQDPDRAHIPFLLESESFSSTVTCHSIMSGWF